MSVTFITVFLQGLLSFFSPCVLPLLPVYMGYLSGGTLKENEDGTKHYDRARVMVNTLFFVIGISFAFFLLGMGLSVIGRFFSGNQLLFVRIGGIIVIMFGLYQLGIFGNSRILSAERRLPIDLGKLSMSPLTALIMGFVISFAWSPCIGPVLSSVLIMAASASRASTGFLLIGVYTLGYVIPFLLVGVFTTSLLEFFGKHRSVVKYSVKIGAVLMILMGVLMFTGRLNSISSYLSQFTGAQITTESEKEESAAVEESTDEIADNDESEEAKNAASSENQTESSADAEDEQQNAAKEDQQPLIPAPDFTLTDQYGVTHSLADYRGKIIFLNFWATWCPPCRAEMPDIQALYEKYSQDENSDVVILGVAFPNQGDEKDAEGIAKFLEDNGYTYPVLMDEGATLQLPYYITAFPTTFIINPDGNVLGYIPGSMTKDIMESVLDQARQ
ncbi:MAG: redoxin domain-containing protein [Butyrivibrio sp.]|nr:cytochrome c biogenesis protein CcdA [Butyrivibrio sp.]MBQ8031364.1 redoxin domain-containing protein [Butyrivibrio sp.]MBR1642816.1 redoxin domain-containing protein [Butyrivibrio sp.]